MIALSISAALCIVPGSVLAQDDAPTTNDLGSTSGEPISILVGDDAVDLAFDTAGSENQKLQFELSESLFFDAASNLRWLNPGNQSILTSGGIGWSMSDSLRLGAQVEQQSSQFTPLGNIQCENGILAADSFRASNCVFTNMSEQAQSGSASIGAEFDIGDNALAAFSLFQEQGNSGNLNATGVVGANNLTNSILTPTVTAPVGTGVTTGILPQFMESEVNGVDLEFQLGISTDNAGEMQLGVQLTRVLDAQFEALYPLGNGLSQWTLAEPVDSARLSFDWQRNDFSGGFQGFFREPMSFLSQPESEGIAMFDVYFSWRTPWNASLSVGASNLLNSRSDEAKAPKSTIIDPFESIYGRIPYVRYKQDL